MSVNHLNGVTTYGAADKLVDWFATFTTWLTGTVGWTLEAAASPTDRVFSSAGEGAAYTKLFFRIWQDPGTNHVRGEVRDDAIGTNETTGLGFFDADIGDVFRYYVVADLDTVLVTVPYRNTTNFLYLGIIEPAAITPVDETYHIIASDAVNDLSAVVLLRWHTGAWDWRVLTVGDQANPAPCLVPGNESMAVAPLYVDDHADMAGQLKFVGRVYDNTANLGVGDQFDSQVVGCDAVWQLFGTGVVARLVLVAGTQPTAGQADGASFFYDHQVVAGIGAFLAAFPAVMANAGWIPMGGGGPHTTNLLFWSDGEDGTKDIWLLFSFDTTGWPTFYIYAQEDAIGTNRTTLCSDIWWNVDGAFDFWFAGDKDCFCLSLDNYWMGGPNNPKAFFWAGVPAPPVAPLPDGLSYYNTLCYSYGPAPITILRQRSAFVAVSTLRDHDGTYSLTNQSNFDVATYFVWPQSLYARYPWAGGGDDYIGDMRYYGYTDGGGVVDRDTITVGAFVYLVLDLNGAGFCRTMRMT